MEQHAVPQDITGFKFKLVGDMTLKQFGELAGGAIVAYIFYATPWPAILKWPFVIIFGFLGFALAFLPIEERPLDVWIVNFIKSIYQPTLYVWKNGAVRPSIATVAVNVTSGVDNPTTQLWPYPQTATPPKPVVPALIPVTPTPPTTQSDQPVSIEDLQKRRDAKVKELEDAVKKLEQATTPPKIDPVPVPSGPPVITVDDLAKKRDEKKLADEAALRALAEQNKQLETQIADAKLKMQALTGNDTTQLQSQLQNLEKQKVDLGTQAATFQAPANEAIKVVTPPAARQTVISLTEKPNVINGTITNSQGAPLDNAILIIKDKAGNSVRALKSNQIGQFIASTPLENGIYYLELERQGYTFDTLELTVDGKIIAPLEIHAKN